MILTGLRRAWSSAILKVSLAAFFILQAMIITGEGWCAYHHWCPRESFLTRVDASVCVLLGTVFLFFAAKQVLRSLFDRQPLVYDRKTTAPLDLDPGDNPHVFAPLSGGDLEPITGPDWWVQPGTDA